MDDFLERHLRVFFNHVIGLTSRETQVAFLVVEGRTNKEIGQKLYVAEKTIKFHLTNIFRKARVSNRCLFSSVALKYVYFHFKRLCQENERAASPPPPTPQKQELPEDVRERAGYLPIGKGVI